MDQDNTSSRSSGNPPLGTPAGRSDAPPAVSIPDHELVRRIGRGSYGEVWLARNMMGTYRAVKIVFRTAFSDQRPYDREWAGIRKFEPISRSHEGFIDVLQVGINEAGGYFYYVMELGDDQRTGQKIDPSNYWPRALAKEIAVHGRLPFRECLELGLALSLALHELHKHGLVHRDVKPSNIIFVNGVPKLADIGLVAGVDEARSYVGTEGFIPPEGPGSSQADVYSLGKVLYEASTGKDRQEFPELPSRVDAFEDYAGFVELNEIMLQACRPEIHKRYQSAWEMHADLLVVANGKSVKRLKALERRLANLKRIAGVGTLALIAAAAVGYQIYREWRAQIEAHQRRVVANLTEGNQAVESGDLFRALPYFAEALRLDQGNRKLELEHRLRIGSILGQCPKLERLWHVPTEPRSVSLDSDGASLLVTEISGAVRALSVVSGKPIPLVLETTNANWAEYSPDRRWIVVASGKKYAAVCGATDGREVLRLNHPDEVSFARFSPDCSRIVTGCEDGKARVWNAKTGEIERVLERHTDAVLWACFSHNGRWIVTASRDGTARVWNADKGDALGAPLEHDSWVYSAEFSPDDRKIVTAGFDKSARVWTWPGGKQVLPQLNHPDGVRTAEFSPDGRFILTGCLDGAVRFWRTDNQLPVEENPVLSHSSRLSQAFFLPDGHRLATICADGTVRIWDLAGSGNAPAPVPHPLCGDGSHYFVAESNRVEVCDTVTGQAVGPAIELASPPVRVEISRFGDFLATLTPTWGGSGVTNCMAQVWEAQTGRSTGPALALPLLPRTVELSADGKRLLCCGSRVIQTWNVADATLLSTVDMSGSGGETTFLSSKAAYIVGLGDETRVPVWVAATGLPAFPPLEHTRPVCCGEFTSDDTRLAIGCADAGFDPCYAQVWDTATGKPVGASLHHKDGVLSVAFSPDGRRLVTASEDFTAIVWDTATGRQVTPSLRHGSKVEDASFSPNGLWVVTASMDKTARIWSAETGEPLSTPLRFPAPLRRARLLEKGRRIVVTSARDMSWTEILPVDERPIEDLFAMARLFSSETVEGSEKTGAPSPESLPPLWQELRDKYPKAFGASIRETLAWHEKQAAAAEADKQWFAARVHIERLLASRPGDASLRARLDRAEQRLRQAD